MAESAIEGDSTKSRGWAELSMKRKDETSEDRPKANSRKGQRRKLEKIKLEDEDNEESEQGWEERPLHPNARTTREMRREFQLSDESSRALARRHGLDEKTVTKHRRRYGVDDLPAGRRSNAFTESETDLMERFRRFTYLNLRDCVERLRPVIPQLNLSNLHRLAKRVGVNRLRWGKTTSIERENSEARIGCFHVCVLHRKADPATAFVAFGEERGEVFAFYAKELTAQKAARFVMTLKGRFKELKLILAPNDPLFGARPLRGHPFEDAEREKYFEHPFIEACEQQGVMRGYSEPIFRPRPRPTIRV